MLNYHPTFGSPWYLAILLILPVLWWLSFRRLAGLGNVRRVFALLFRTLVVTLLVLAAADSQMVRTSDKLTVIYLLDQSFSIPAPKRRAMIEYVNREVHEHRKKDDRAGVIVFGRDAAIEIPPFDDDLQMAGTIESLLDPEYTNLAAAMKLAQATFPEDAAKRIVLVTDGNQNMGNALEQAQGLASAGIGIDVVPIRYHTRAEVAVERVILPSDVRRGQPFDLRIVVSNSVDLAPGDKGEVHGRLVLSQLTEDQPVVLSDEKVTLPPGKKVFTVRQKIDQANFYTYEAKFVPDRPEDDSMPQNNRATAFTHVVGKGQVLLVEDFEHRGENDLLVKRLRQQGLEVTVRATDQLFSTLAELQPFDTVILANVPRATNEDVSFTDEQIDMLVRNTQQMGSGLVMLGGPNSFGAGGWTGTELEKAMPVDFQIRNAKVAPKGALVMLMHASEMATGNHMQKVICREAIKSLSAQDLCGVMQWSGVERWIVGGGLLSMSSDRERLLAAVDRMVPGDMPDFEPAVQLAVKGFAGLKDVAIKHMIIISDGDPSPPSTQTMQALLNMKVTISTVAVGAHMQPQSLMDIAAQGGGKFYSVTNPKALPRIFQKEARRVSRPLVYEKESGLSLRQKSLHEMLNGIEELPKITGFVLTSKKENPLVEIALVSSQPAGEENSTVLAGWTYGLGRAVAFTSDAGIRWTKDWPSRAVYDKLFGQIVRWSMRPTGGAGKFTTAFEQHEGQMRVVITALDKNEEFLNFLTMTGTAVGPDLKKPLSVAVEQTAPGRYVATFPTRDAGSYFVTINPGRGMAPIRTGVNVPYSDEFRDRGPNEPLLTQLAATVTKDGSPGRLIDDPKAADTVEPLLAVNSFRHDLPKATSSQETWHWLLLMASCVFLGDVFIRRVHVHFAWVPPLAVRVRDFVLRRQPAPAQPQYIERLKSRKAEVGDKLEQLRAATRFELPAETPVDVQVLEELTSQGPSAVQPPVAKPSLTPEQKEEESYTERLLKAKKKVWDERDKQ